VIRTRTDESCHGRTIPRVSGFTPAMQNNLRYGMCEVTTWWEKTQSRGGVGYVLCGRLLRAKCRTGTTLIRSYTLFGVTSYALHQRVHNHPSPPPLPQINKILPLEHPWLCSHKVGSNRVSLESLAETAFEICTNFCFDWFFLIVIPSDTTDKYLSISDAALAVYSTGRTTGLVLDSGDSSFCTAVYEGIQQSQAILKEVVLFDI